MVLAGFAEMVGTRGGDVLDILTRAAIAPSALTDGNALIGWAAYGAAMEMAAEQVGDPDFGFEVALALPDVFPNAVAPVLMATEGQSMLDWFQSAATHWRFFTNGYSVTVHPTADGAVCLRLEFPQHSFTPRHVMELTFATFCRLWRDLGGHAQDPAWVHFRHRAPASLDRLAGFFGSGLAFEQSHYEIGFTPSQVQARIGPSEHRKQALIDWLVRRRIETLPGYDQSMGHTVSLIVTSILGAGLCNIEFVASSLSLNPKKLQRLLAQEGTTFSRILEAVRERLALRLLTDTDVGIAQIAGLLDYAGTAPFSLAVRRWYGMSPVAVRHRSVRENLRPSQMPFAGFALTDR